MFGQEFQDDCGLNMNAIDLRQYDPAMGRWVVQDPVTHHDYSPYSAFDNNPVYWSDPSGADSQLYKDKNGNVVAGSFDGQDAQNLFNQYLNSSSKKSEEEVQNMYEFTTSEENDGNGGGGDGSRTKLATSLVKVYQKNNKMQMAYSLIANTLFETTEIGDLSRQAREEFIKTYGTVNAQKYSDVYGYMIDVLKEIKDQNKGNKYLSDYYVTKTSATLFLKATGLEIENQVLEQRIKRLDINLYYIHINPSAAPKIGGFSGGGAGGQW